MSNSVNFDEYSSNYNKILQSQHKNLGDISYYNKYKIDILKNKLNSKEKLNILEFGCGIGRNLSHLSNTFINSAIYGFDISKMSIKIAKEENPNITFIEEKSLKEYKAFFNLIFISGVYHHIPLDKREEVTKLIRKLSKKDALIIIFEHNPYNPITRNMVNTCIFDEDAILLKRKELINLFTSNNFEYIESEYTLFFPPKLSFLKKIEKYLGWCFLGGQYYIVVKLDV